MRTFSFICMMILSGADAFAKIDKALTTPQNCRTVGVIKCASNDHTLAVNFEKLQCKGVNFGSAFLQMRVRSAGIPSVLKFKGNIYQAVGAIQNSSGLYSFGVFGMHDNTWGIEIQQKTAMQNSKFGANLVNSGSGFNLRPSTAISCVDAGLNPNTLPGM